MIEDDDSLAKACAAAAGCLALKVKVLGRQLSPDKDEFATLGLGATPAWLHSLDLSLPINLRRYKLSMRTDVVEALLPGQVEVQQCGDDIEFWLAEPSAMESCEAASADRPDDSDSCREWSDAKVEDAAGQAYGSIGNPTGKKSGGLESNTPAWQKAVDRALGPLRLAAHLEDLDKEDERCMKAPQFQHTQQ